MEALDNWKYASNMKEELEKFGDQYWDYLKHKTIESASDSDEDSTVNKPEPPLIDLLNNLKISTTPEFVKDIQPIQIVYDQNHSKKRKARHSDQLTCLEKAYIEFCKVNRKHENQDFLFSFCYAYQFNQYLIKTDRIQYMGM